MAEISVSNASQLAAALRSAQAGDEILLESGDYGNFDFNGHNYSDYVTIRSADGNQGATFDGVTFTNSSHIRIDGVHVDSPSNGSSSSAIVRFEASSNNIQFMNSEVNAPIDDEYWGHYAFHVAGADNIRIEGNNVHNVKDGVWAVSASNVEIVGNEFDMLGRDTIKFASINGLLIEDNVGPRSVFAQPGAHIDFIQGQGSSSNITIRGNLLLPENGYSSQGIFLGDAVYNNVLIEQNILYNTLVRAISVNDGTNIVAQNNTVLTVPGQGHKQASIILPSGSTSRDNIVGSNQGGPNGSNFYAEWDDPSSAYYYDKLFVNASTGQGVTLEDLRPVEGGPADNPNLGAYLRLMELLDGAGARPVAADDAVTVIEDQSVTINLLVNDSDPEGQALELVSVGNPSNGTTVSNADGTVTYTPDANFVGEDSFSYTIRNADGVTQTGRASVSVTGIDDDAPVAEFDLANVIQGRAAVIDVLANDFDPDGGPLTLLGHTDTAKGVLTDLGNGRFSYLADEDATGTDSFSYTIQDASGATATATVTVNIQELGALPAPFFTAAGTGAPEVIAHDPALLLDAGTLELVFTADQLSARQGLFSKDSAYYDNGGHLTVLLEGNTLVVRLQSVTETYEVRIADAVTLGKAHHVALTFGTGGMQVYLDGVLVGSNNYAGGLAGNAEPIVIGANQWGSGDGVADQLQDPFEGNVSKVSLYSNSLEAEVISLLASAQANVKTTTLDNVLYGSTDSDLIFGGLGDDTIDGDIGNDRLDGGDGIDTLSFASLNNPGFNIEGIAFGAIVDLASQGTAQDTGQGKDTFENFENLEGSNLNDGLFGDDGENIIDGAAGRDFLAGGAGNDTLIGGADFDVLEGGEGADVLFGGTTGGGAIETDIAGYFGANGPLNFVFGSSISEFEDGTSVTLIDDVLSADIEGIAGADDFSNTFNAEDITDTTFLMGGSQSDTFFGGSGTDQLLGLAGDDVLFGNDGRDALIGEGGDDDYFGGLGQDSFFLDGINEGNDTIHDLELGVDMIQFTGGNVTAYRLDDIDANNDGIMDTLMTYEVDGAVTGTITIMNHDAAAIEAEADTTIIL